MLRVKAQELLDDPDYLDRLTMDSFYDLLRQAGYNESDARRETSQRSWDRLASGKMMT